MSVVIIVVWNIFLLLMISGFVLIPLGMMTGYDHMILLNFWIVFPFAIVIGCAILAVTPVGDVIIRLSLSVRKPIQREQAVYAHHLKALTARIAQLPKGMQLDPKVYIQDQPVMNAASLGKNTLILTTGLLQNADDEEIRGVIAHELGHMVYGDSVRLSAVLGA